MEEGEPASSVSRQDLKSPVIWVWLTETSFEKQFLEWTRICKLRFNHTETICKVTQAGLDTKHGWTKKWNTDNKLGTDIIHCA